MSTANHHLTKFSGWANPLAPRFVKKADAVRIIGSLKLVERMLHASQPGKPKSTVVERIIVLRSEGVADGLSNINIATAAAA